MEEARAVVSTLDTTIDGKRVKRGILSWTFACLVLFFVVYCARPEDIFRFNGIPIAKIAAILAIGSFALAVLTGPNVLRVSREMWYLVLLVIWLGIGIPFSPIWKGGALQATLEFSKIVPITFLIGIAVNTQERLKRLMFVQTASVMMVLLLTLAKVGNHATADDRLTGVVGGDYGNPNDLAFALVLVVPFCALFILNTRNIFKKLLWTATASLMIYGVLLTYSRAGLLALMMAGAIILWKFGIKERRFGSVFFAGILGISVFLFAGPQGYFRRVQTIVDPNVDFKSDKGSWVARQGELIRSLEITAEHPIFGVGTGNFIVTSPDWHVTHNAYTELSADGGIPALCFYLLVLWATFANLKDALRLSKEKPEIRYLSGALLASFGAFLVGSFFCSVSYNFFSYFLVGYAGALIQIARAGASAEPEIVSPGERLADINSPMPDRLEGEQHARIGGVPGYQSSKYNR
ncbi:MAG TPA: O-antigen ligase family protein [Terriglobia bacterium]|nr:O-antigen ligase family protein [Terriglobia bacterium]